METAEVTKRLREQGITPTNQRIRIAAVILEKTWHFSAEQLLEETNREGKVASKATIYNTLDLFARRGLVKQLVVDPDRVYYDSSTHHHHHFFDPDTQQLFDIQPDQIDIKLPAALPAGKEIADVSVVIQLRSAQQTVKAA